jgi:hypothetical protein
MIDSSHFALVAFPGAVPELAVNPGDPGYEPIGLDSAKNRPCLRIDLVDFPVAILPDPEHSFGPCQSGVSAASGRGYRSEHIAGPWVDLLDAIFGDLIKMPAIEGRSGMRSDVDCAHHLSARRIEGVQSVSGRKPDKLTIERYPVDLTGIREGAILAKDFGG